MNLVIGYLILVICWRRRELIFVFWNFRDFVIDLNRREICDANQIQRGFEVR